MPFFAAAIFAELSLSRFFFCPLLRLAAASYCHAFYFLPIFPDFLRVAAFAFRPCRFFFLIFFFFALCHGAMKELSLLA